MTFHQIEITCRNQTDNKSNAFLCLFLMEDACRKVCSFLCRCVTRVVRSGTCLRIMCSSSVHQRRAPLSRTVRPLGRRRQRPAKARVRTSLLLLTHLDLVQLRPLPASHASLGVSRLLSCSLYEVKWRDRMWLATGPCVCKLAFDWFQSVQDGWVSWVRCRTGEPRKTVPLKGPRWNIWLDLWFSRW